jgi:hypothetical protein
VFTWRGDIKKLYSGTITPQGTIRCTNLDDTLEFSPSSFCESVAAIYHRKGKISGPEEGLLNGVSLRDIIDQYRQDHNMVTRKRLVGETNALGHKRTKIATLPGSDDEKELQEAEAEEDDQLYDSTDFFNSPIFNKMTVAVTEVRREIRESQAITNQKLNELANQYDSLIDLKAISSQHSALILKVCQELRELKTLIQQQTDNKQHTEISKELIKSYETVVRDHEMLLNKKEFKIKSQLSTDTYPDKNKVQELDKIKHNDLFCLNSLKMIQKARKYYPKEKLVNYDSVSTANF